MQNNIGVYFFDKYVGQLSQDKYGTLCFQYDQDYVAKNGQPISHSMPLTNEMYYGNEAHSFFTGLLPEENMLTTTANVIGTSSLNYFKLLTELGKESVGAIQIGNQAIPANYQYEEISLEYLNQIVNQTDSLLSTLYQEKELRLSLAGAQSKTGLYYKNDRYYIPKNGSPSNIIVKPANSRFPDLVYNEYACMKIAESLGIQTPLVRLASTETQFLYIIDRYDRMFYENEIQRLHQEDFCQALGIQNQNKYESDGGPTFQQCIHLLRKATTVPAIEVNKFVSLFLFNLIIGNRDAHGKNYSILHKNNKRGLAPAYDILSTAYYDELSIKMSMSINGKFELDEVLEEDLFIMSESANISGNIVLKEYQRIKDQILTSAEHILKENIFPVGFQIRFFEHLRKLHSELKF